jgi:hypothetical protein
MNGQLAVTGLLGSVLLTLTASCFGQEPRQPVAATAHFALYSDFAFNLHDALLAAAVARRAGQSELFGSEAATACFNGLPSAQRAGWNRAVDYYAEIIAPGQAFDRQQIVPRLELLWRADDWARGDERTSIVIARSFRSAAEPAYQRCRWPEQDARNRAWIEALRPALARYEDVLARRLVELYGADWQALPIPVDVMETVSWAGADSILTRPPPGHVRASSTRAEFQTPAAALEVVFHEASHLLMNDGSPLFAALGAAERAAEQPAPPDLWHAVLFYMTGETVRRVLEDAGEPRYTPLLSTLNIFADVREPIASAWSRYLDGERSLTEAATQLLETFDSEP